jgi:hypothetical protein
MHAETVTVESHLLNLEVVSFIPAEREFSELILVFHGQKTHEIDNSRPILWLLYPVKTTTHNG